MGFGMIKPYLAIIIGVAFLFTMLQLQITDLKSSAKVDHESTGPSRENAVRAHDSDTSSPPQETDRKRLMDMNAKQLRGGHKVYLDEKAKASEDDQMLIIYNRIPKTGSTSFVSILYKLYKENNFNVLYVNLSRTHVMSLPDQMLFSRNITTWTERLPSVYHGHLPFVNFRKLGIAKQPLYINILREPLERLVSYYYFLRYGDAFRPYLRRSKQGDKTTFDECVQRNGKDCQSDKLWLQIPFFCGHFPQCWEPGSKWALEQAKRHLVDDFFLVGVTEKMDQFVRLLELSIPRIFKGATHEYMKADGGIHLRKTKKKNPLLPATIEKLKSSKAWELENEFYQFAKKVFEDTYKMAVGNKKTLTKPNKGAFFYQKVKPEVLTRR